jgi:hypothetical protein
MNALKYNLDCSGFPCLGEEILTPSRCVELLNDYHAMKELSWRDVPEECPPDGDYVVQYATQVGKSEKQQYLFWEEIVHISYSSVWCPETAFITIRAAPYFVSRLDAPTLSWKAYLAPKWREIKSIYGPLPLARTITGVRSHDHESKM